MLHRNDQMKFNDRSRAKKRSRRGTQCLAFLVGCFLGWVFPVKSPPLAISDSVAETSNGRKTTIEYLIQDSDSVMIRWILNESVILNRFVILQKRLYKTDGRPTNSLLFGSEVPIADVMLVAEKLISADVEIDLIQQQDDWPPAQAEILRIDYSATADVLCDRPWTIDALNEVVHFDTASDVSYSSGCSK